MSMWSVWNQWFVCYLEVFWFGVLSLLVFWSVIIDSVGLPLPLITLLQLTSESTGIVQCFSGQVLVVVAGWQSSCESLLVVAVKAYYAS